MSWTDFGSEVLLLMALTVMDLNSEYLDERLSRNCIAWSGPEGTASSPELLRIAFTASLNLNIKSVMCSSGRIMHEK